MEVFMCHTETQVRTIQTTTTAATMTTAINGLNIYPPVQTEPGWQSGDSSSNGRRNDHLVVVVVGRGVVYDKGGDEGGCQHPNCHLFLWGRMTVVSYGASVTEKSEAASFVSSAISDAQRICRLQEGGWDPTVQFHDPQQYIEQTPRWGSRAMPPLKI